MVELAPTQSYPKEIRRAKSKVFISFQSRQDFRTYTPAPVGCAVMQTGAYLTKLVKETGNSEILKTLC